MSVTVKTAIIDGDQIEVREGRFGRRHYRAKVDGGALFQRERTFATSNAASQTSLGAARRAAN